MEEKLSPSKFMAELIPVQQSNYIFHESKTFDRIHEITHKESLTEPIVATFFWDIISYTSYYKNNFSKFTDIKELDLVDSMVIHHGINETGSRQYSLLVQIPKLLKDKHYLLRVNDIPRREIVEAFSEWSRKNQSALATLERFLSKSEVTDKQVIERFRKKNELFFSVDPEFIFPILDKVDMIVVFNRAAEEILTSCSKADPSHKVKSDFGYETTAGVYGYAIIENNGINTEVFGVTVCRHGLIKEKDWKMSALNKKVNIDGVEGIVVSDDQTSDSCFVALDKSKVTGIVPCLGPLTNIPDVTKKFSFEGISSGKKQTTIMFEAWRSTILTPKPQIQRTFWTQPATDIGDSGAPLLDNDGTVLGFSFSRSGIYDNPQYSNWIWADSVFQIHNLKLEK